MTNTKDNFKYSMYNVFLRMYWKSDDSTYHNKQYMSECKFT